MVATKQILIKLLWLVSLAPTAVISASSGASLPVGDNRLNQIATTVSGGEVFHTHDIELGRRRTEFVRHILTDRLKYVESGKRMADFHTWIEKRRGDPVIISTHGGEVDTGTIPTSQQANYNEDMANSKVLSVFTRNDPFSVDRLNLDLPANSLPNLYEGKPIHLIDDLEPSMLQLFLRTIQLSIKFSPVLSTTFLAAISKTFRKVWYKWVSASLGKLE